jgi:hypothetical protein
LACRAIRGVPTPFTAAGPPRRSAATARPPGDAGKIAFLELSPMRLLGKALTFDDVLLVPAYSEVLPKDASLATQFTRNIQLNIPLVSAALFCFS